MDRLGRGAALVVAATAIGWDGGARAEDVADERRPRDRGIEVGAATGMFVGGEGGDPVAEAPLGDTSGDVIARVALWPLRHAGVEAEGGAVFGGGTGGAVLALRASAVAQLPGRVTPFLVAGAGTMWSASSATMDQDDQLALWHAGAGAKLYMAGRWYVRVDARAYTARGSVGEGALVDHWGITAGAGMSFAGPGIAGRGDAEAVATRGAAPGAPVTDAGDGAAAPPQERPDAAPAAPAPAAAIANDTPIGTPDAHQDADGDGVTDATDACIDRAEDPDSFQDQDGCPEPDNDRDRVADAIDGCPLVAGPVHNRGCPDTDQDRDGVLDGIDNCPTVAGKAAQQGCTTPQIVALTSTSLELLDRPSLFAGRQARLRPAARAVLDSVAQVLRAHPERPVLRVESHTDDRGDAAKNKALTVRRAEIVVAALVERGVPRERLEPVGHGGERPFADNDTVTGRNANNRIELNFVSASPVGAPAPAGSPAPAGPPAPAGSPPPAGSPAPAGSPPPNGSPAPAGARP